MIPWLGSRQFIERVLREYGVEVTKMRWNVLFVIRELGVLLEALRELLGNRSGRVDILHLGEESGCPDSVAFFKRFIWKVGFRIGKQFRCWFGFVFLIGIFYEGQERTSLAGIYLFNVFPLGVSFHLAVGLAAYTALQEASGHLDGSGTEVDLQIMFVQPGEPEYHALGDCKQDVFGMLVVGHDHIDNFMDAPSLIKGSVHVVNWNRLGQLVGWEFGLGDEVLVNEIPGSTGVNHGFHRQFFHSVCHLQIDREHNALWAKLEGMGDELVLHLFFPFR